MAGKYVRNNNEKFVNPYTFVGLEQSKKNTVNAVEYYSTNELLTGELDCTITVKTPLAILDVETKKMDFNQHPSYEFYRVNNKLTIPGSTIRGEIRNLYETLTNSCMLTVEKDKRITRRIEASADFGPGLLIKENNGWVLYEAEKHKYPRRKASEKDVGTYVEDFDNDGEPICGYNVFGESFGNNPGKGFLFEKKSKVINDSEFVKGLMDGLEYSVAEYRNPAINKNYANGTHSGYWWYEKAKGRGVIPVWFSYKDGLYYLSLAGIGRSAYNHRMGELIKDKVTCTTRSGLCPACLLFGMVGTKGDAESLGSRLRFTDATIIKNPERRSYTLKELGTPRSSYLPFYLKSGENYDSNNAQIAGRKFYWHNCAAATDSSVFTTLEKNNRNATVEVVGRDTTFGFKVYFDSITKEQLENLVYCLTFGENNSNGIMCHKLGHGKPLGLGSVKISIDRLVERKLSDGYKLEVIDGKKICDVLPNPESRMYKVDDVKKVHNYSSVEGKNVRYPYIVPKGVVRKANDCASHQWFTQFKKQSRGSKLPVVGSDNQELFAFDLNVNPQFANQKSSKDNNRNNGNNRNHRNNKKFNKGKKY